MAVDKAPLPCGYDRVTPSRFDGHPMLAMLVIPTDRPGDLTGVTVG
ncbi:MAG: hypothetical protein H6980_04905 [Gammaproteobacteria bacterium]|nr:hypothetical protein [Gammaproteobacteria bacterium]